MNSARNTYTLDIETFNTPVASTPTGYDFQSHKLERRQIVGYRAAVAQARAEAAKGAAGRIVILRDASGKGRKF